LDGGGGFAYCGSVLLHEPRQIDPPVYFLKEKGSGSGDRSL
jgi:hypothetical protein